MTKYINQFLINCIKELPQDVLNKIKDFIYLNNIDQWCKIHKIKQELKKEMDITLFWIIERFKLTYTIYYAEDKECENYFPLINNCRDCGDYIICKKCTIDNSYIPEHIRCIC